MISRIFKNVASLSVAVKTLAIASGSSIKAFPLVMARNFAEPQKDQWFDSVRYTVDTTGLDYMHVMKDSAQWDQIVVNNKKPVVVCFYAT